jgi:integrase
LPDRSWISLGLLSDVTLAAAREAAQTRRAQASLGETPTKRNAAGDLTLRQFLNEHYEPWMKATYRGSIGQVERIRYAFPDFLDLSLSDITAARVDRWRATRRHRGSKESTSKAAAVAGSTLNRDLAALQASLSRAVEWGRLSRNPVRKMKRSTEDESALVRYLSDEEEKRLRKALGSRDTARRAARESANVWRRERGYEPWPAHGTYTDHLTPLVLLALNTGLRRGKLLRLAWRDVDLKRRLMTVRGTAAKTGQTRHVPLNSEAVQVLEKHAGDEVHPQAFVFANGRWKRRYSSSCHWSARLPGQTTKHRCRSPRAISSLMRRPGMIVLPAPGSSASRNRRGCRGSMAP